MSRILAVCAAAAALAAGVFACGGDSDEATRPDAAAAIAAGESYATEAGADVREGTRFLRSTRDPEWALVSGSLTYHHPGRADDVHHRDGITVDGVVVGAAV